MPNLKLEIGPGDVPLESEAAAGADSGWVHCRFEDARWGQQPLPYPDEHFDEVYASHVLEHVPWPQTQAALVEARRVLKPGGLLEVWVPDFAYIIDCYHKQICGDTWRRGNPEDDPMVWVNGRIFTYGPGEGNWHHATFDANFLEKRLHAAGFSRVSMSKTRSRGASHGAIDLGGLAWR